MAKLIDILDNGNYSCVIQNQNETRTFSQKGVADLYSLLKNEPDFLENAIVADKIVGKGAATLLILGKITCLYTHTISTLALDFLRQYPIELSYETEVPNIINRSKTDWCPLEKLLKDCNSPSEGILVIKDFVNMKR